MYAYDRYMAENKQSGQRVVVKELKQTDHEAQVAFVHEVAILKAIRLELMPPSPTPLLKNAYNSLDLTKRDGWNTHACFILIFVPSMCKRSTHHAFTLLSCQPPKPPRVQGTVCEERDAEYGH